MADPSRWPELPQFEEWESTYHLLHRFAQMAGKLRLAHEPWINHSWGSALYLTTSGLTTSPIPHPAGHFTISLDLIRDRIAVESTSGDRPEFAIRSMSVADLYANLQQALKVIGAETEIFSRPVEVAESISFEEDDAERDWDHNSAEKYWRAMLSLQDVFREFRSRFIGKVSPVHLFWGGFDMAVTRFSGRTAPKHPGGIPNCADWVMEEAYSHELSSAGFFAGDGFGEAAMYAYAYPAPDGFADYKIKPSQANFDHDLGEFILTYRALLQAEDPSASALAFLQTTYEAASNLGSWDREALENERLPGRNN